MVLDGRDTEEDSRVAVKTQAFVGAFLVGATFFLGFGMGWVSKPQQIAVSDMSAVTKQSEKLEIPLAVSGTAGPLIVGDWSENAIITKLRDDEWTKMRGFLREECGQSASSTRGWP